MSEMDRNLIGELKKVVSTALVEEWGAARKEAPGIILYVDKLMEKVQAENLVSSPERLMHETILETLTLMSLTDEVKIAMVSSELLWRAAQKERLQKVGDNKLKEDGWLAP